MSKLENSRDSDLKLGDLEQYANAIDLELRLGLAPDNQTLVDDVKYHAFSIKALLGQLAKLAERDEQIAEGVANFVCGEVPFNMLKMVVQAAKSIPGHHVYRRLPGLVLHDESIKAGDTEDDDEAVDNSNSSASCA